MSIPRTKPIVRKAGIRKRNPKRRQSEFDRTYGSKERVEFVKALRCLIGYCLSGAENHHIENGGMSRKADYTKIVPLCEIHHEQCHHIGRETFERVYGLDLEKAAAETEAKWQRFLEQSTEGTA